MAMKLERVFVQQGNKAQCGRQRFRLVRVDAACCGKGEQGFDLDRFVVWKLEPDKVFRAGPELPSVEELLLPTVAWTSDCMASAYAKIQLTKRA
jgi:hypothetical protein